MSGLKIVLIATVSLALIGVPIGVYAYTRRSGGGVAAPEGTVAANEKISAPAYDYKREFAENRIATSKIKLTDAQKQAIKNNPEARVDLTPEQREQSLQVKKAKMKGQKLNFNECGGCQMR